MVYDNKPVPCGLRKYALSLLLALPILFFAAPSLAIGNTWGGDAFAPAESIFIHESPGEITPAWQNAGIRRATVVHSSPISGLGIGDGKNVSASNHLYMAHRRRLIKEVYWVMPQGLFNNIPLADRSVKQYLLESSPELPVKEVHAMVREGGCVKGRLNGVPVRLCSTYTLPILKDPVILHMAVSFVPEQAFAARISNLGVLKDWFHDMTARLENIVRMDVSIGVEDGLLRPVHRYLVEEFYTIASDLSVLEAADPPALWKVRDTADNMYLGDEDVLVLEHIANEGATNPGDSALMALRAATYLRTDELDRAFDDAEALCRVDIRECYMFAYLAGVLKKNGRKAEAMRFLDAASEAMPGLDIDALDYPSSYPYEGIIIKQDGGVN